MKAKGILILVIIIAIAGGAWWFTHRDQPTAGDTIYEQYVDVPAETYVGSDIKMTTYTNSTNGGIGADSNSTYALLNIDHNYLYDNKILQIFTVLPGNHFQENSVQPDSQGHYRANDVNCNDHQATVHLIVENKTTKMKRQLVISSYCDGSY